jgi:hypothetical protein
MRRRRGPRLLACLAGLLAVGIAATAALVSRERLLESWWLFHLDSADPAIQKAAAKGLHAMRSERGILRIPAELFEDDDGRPWLDRFETLPEGVSIRATASTLGELCRKVKPLAWWDLGDMLWVNEDSDKLEVTVDKAQVFKPSGRPACFVLVDLDWKSFDSWYDKVNPRRETVHLTKEILPSDEGSYLVEAGRSPNGDALYEAGLESPPGSEERSAGFFRRHLFILRTQEGRWLFVGEGVQEERPRSETVFIRTVEKRSVEWTGDAEAPVQVSFIFEDLLRDVSTRYTAVLEGRLPAKLRTSE